MFKLQAWGMRHKTVGKSHYVKLVDVSTKRREMNFVFSGYRIGYRFVINSVHQRNTKINSSKRRLNSSIIQLLWPMNCIQTGKHWTEVKRERKKIVWRKNESYLTCTLYTWLLSEYQSLLTEDQTIKMFESEVNRITCIVPMIGLNYFPFFFFKTEFLDQFCNSDSTVHLLFQSRYSIMKMGRLLRQIFIFVKTFELQNLKMRFFFDSFDFLRSILCIVHPNTVLECEWYSPNETVSFLPLISCFFSLFSIGIFIKSLLLS